MRDRNPDNSPFYYNSFYIRYMCIKLCFMYSTDSVLCIRVNANDLFIWLQAIIIKLSFRFMV